MLVTPRTGARPQQSSEKTLMMALTNVSKFFPMGRGKQLHAVEDVSLSIGKEQVVGLVGESGSGKSTLGRMIVGLHSRDQGDILSLIHI